MSEIGSITFDHIGIMVADIDAAVEWYATHLGLEVRDRWQNDEIGMKWAHLTRDALTIEFVERLGLTEASASAGGFHHLALVVDSAERVTRLLEQAGANVVFEPSYFDRHDMDWSFVQDPFGNVLELVSYRSTA